MASAEPMTVKFWGVRGSTPVCGPEHAVFGGATQCIEISAGGERIVVDAGSGLYKLGRECAAGGARRTDILLTHLHLDHVMGLMTFRPIYEPGFKVAVHAPAFGAIAPGEALAALLRAPFHPVAADRAGCEFSVRAFSPPSAFSVGGFDIATLELNHPGGACGYRIGAQGRSVAVIADHEHGDCELDDAIARFCAGVDLILYDAHWDEAEDYEAHRGWGHSTWQAGLRLREAAGAGTLGCIHHAPEATDTILAEREERLSARHRGSFFAREGTKLCVGV